MEAAPHVADEDVAMDFVDAEADAPAPLPARGQAAGKKQRGTSVLNLLSREAFLTDVDVTTAQDVRHGDDQQGIPWNRLPWTRADYRRVCRVLRGEANSKVNCPDIPHASLACEVAPVDENAALYEFASSCRKAKASIVHFQLRHLVHAVSSRDVFFSAAGQHGICHWDAVTRTQRLALPVEADVQISTCAAWPTGTGEQNYIVAAGGFAGELIVRSVPLCDGAAELEGNTRTQSTGIGVGQQRIMTGSAATGGLGSGGTSAVFARRISTDENAITNAIVYAPSLGAGGAPGVVASNNDCVVRAFDGTAMRENGRFPFPWAVNYTAVSPCGRLAIVVGDSTTCALLDLTSAQVVAHLAGHLDFSFAASWHPDGSCFATGSQDATARIWDIRRLATARRVLQGKLGAIRSLCFSHDGAALAAAEPADFVHVYDCGADFRRSQVVDLFGEIAGIDFSPCSETLFVSVADLTYGSLMEFKRTRPHRKRLSLL